MTKTCSLIAPFGITLNITMNGSRSGLIAITRLSTGTLESIPLSRHRGAFLSSSIEATTRSVERYPFETSRLILARFSLLSQRFERSVAIFACLRLLRRITSRSYEMGNAYGYGVSLVVELRNLKLRPKLCRVPIKKGLDMGILRQD